VAALRAKGTMLFAFTFFRAFDLREETHSRPVSRVSFRQHVETIKAPCRRLLHCSIVFILFDILTTRLRAVILETSLGGATVVVLSSLHVRFKSPNALWRLYQFYHKAVLEGRGLYPKFAVIRYFKPGQFYFTSLYKKLIIPIVPPSPPCQSN
jgi:hypothetical protein